MCKRIVMLATAAALLMTSGPAAAKLRVVATITDLGSVATLVGGEDAEVTVLCPGPMDAHYLPAKPSLTRKLSKADLLVYNGLELEIGWLPLLIAKARNPQVRPGGRGELDCAQAVTGLLEVPIGSVDRSQGDIHPLGNPHYTLDPRRMVEVAALMAEQMAMLDSEHADAYYARADAFAREVAARMPRWLELAGQAARYPVIVYHRHWTYLADWTGLNIIDAIEHRPGIAPSPRHVRDVIAKGRALGEVIVVCAQWDYQDAVNEVAQRIDCPAVVLPGQTGALAGSDDYFAFIDMICTRLASAAAEVGEGR